MRTAGLLAAMMLITAHDARAEFFKYKDSSGAVVITDKLENVPKKYRGQLKVVWDEELEAKDPLVRHQAAANGLSGDKRQEPGQRAPTDGKRLGLTVDHLVKRLAGLIE